MDENGTNINSDAPCKESLAWQSLLDEQLGLDETELLMHHLASCPACAEKLRTLSDAKSFCEDQLGSEDEDEEDTSSVILDRAKLNIQSQRPPLKPTRFGRSWWRYPAIAAAVFVALLSVLFLPSVWRRAGASAESVLAEAVLRERARAYQPGKVLRWVTESDFTGIAAYPDGRYRTTHWQCNCDGGLAFLTRRYDQNHELIEAFWHQPNGTEIRFVRAAGDLVEVTPADDELEAAQSTLDGALRRALETYLTRRIDGSRQHLRTQNFADWLRRALTPTDPRSYVKIVDSTDWGRVYHLHIEQDYTSSNSRFVRVVSEQEIAGSTYQRLRVKNTRYRADGSSATDDTRYTEMQEVTRDDFAINDLSELMR
ncbi:MAG: hypothetical protein ABI882_17385, partial [Acidobacteriota bacterium]